MQNSTPPDGATDPIGVERDIVLHQLYAACTLVLMGGLIGLVGVRLADAGTAATVGTAVIGAGAALLPTHAAATVSSRRARRSSER